MDSMAQKREVGHAVEILTLGQKFGSRQLFCLQKTISNMVEAPDFVESYDAELDAMSDLLLQSEDLGQVAYTVDCILY